MVSTKQNAQESIKTLEKREQNRTWSRVRTNLTTPTHATDEICVGSCLHTCTAASVWRHFPLQMLPLPPLLILVILKRAPFLETNPQRQRQKINRFLPWYIDTYVTFRFLDPWIS
ncbi:unnamed protein product, partial [Sphacelaria rigidula]